LAVDGRPAWSVDLGGRAEAPGVLDGDGVFIATKTKTLFRLDASTGVVRWKVALPGTVLHPPTFFGEMPRVVLCGTWEGELVAYDAATGRLRWSVPLGAKLAGAPLAAPGLVAAVTADGTVHGYDPAGRSSWTTPGVADGPATLLWQETAGTAPRLLSASRMLVRLDASTGQRADEYPKGALEELRRRFADAMLEGVKRYSEGEKHAIQEREAFEIAGPPFAPARLFGLQLAFGTEEGWAYVFDAVRLRPTARFRAGEPASGLAPPVAERALASAGEDLYALDLRTGHTAWKRTVGARAVTIAGDHTLGVLAGGRVHAIEAVDGALEWSLRGSFRSLAAPAAGAEPAATTAAPWLVDDGEGNLRALQAPGRLAGEPLPIGGELLAALPVSARAWLAATREGTLFGVEWVDAQATDPAGAPGRLARTTEKAWGEPLSEIRVAGGRALVRSASGTLASLDLVSLEESWRITLPKEDRLQALPDQGALLVLGAAGARVYDWGSGAVKAQHELSGAPLAAALRDGSLDWLDRSGAVHRAHLADGRTETARLELPLAEALPVSEGFLVTTSAGEVGFVEVTAAAAPAAAREE
jgi:outer membrane protein assembly factor BamB